MENISLIRAIGAEFMRRKLRGLAMLCAVGVVIALVLSIWLMSISMWWIILLMLVIIGAVGVVIALVTVAVAIKVVRPSLTPEQHSGVQNFVDKLERVADNLQTPKIIILFRIVRDIVRPSEQTFIGTVAHDSTTLHSDYRDLLQLLH